MNDTRTAPRTDERTAVSPEPLWRTVVLNDPVNLMGYVVLVFKKVLGMSREDAERHMLEVHRDGRSAVWIGPREPAEHRVHELQRWHLRAILEPDSDARP